MNRSLLLLLSVAGLEAMLASGCATTGDPNSGGLFGWSESKAQQRQAAARYALEEEERKGDELRAEQRQLQAQIDRKKKELARLKKGQTTNSSYTPYAPSAAETAQISRLEKEIDELTRESMLLMGI